MLDRYVAYLQGVRGMSEHTCRAYERDLRIYLSFLESTGVVPLEIRDRTLRAFVSELLGRGLKPRSVNRVLSSVRGYTRFLERTEPESQPGRRAPGQAADIIMAFRGPKVGSRLPGFLFEGEMTEVLEAADGDTHLGLRDRAALETLYSTGCRVGELVGMNVTDLDLKKGTVRVLGKGRKERYVYLGDEATRALQDYLPRRAAHLGARAVSEDARVALFLNRNGERVTDRGFRYRLRSLVQTTGIRKRVSPHTFRHSMATHVLDRGADIRVVQELLGHASLATTQIYTHVGLARLARVYRQAHPHARSTRDPGSAASGRPLPGSATLDREEKE
jgi:integrase/recombinase XerC/integrase/recombinase XerD